MHYALASSEDNDISALADAINEIESANVDTLMFDGVIVRIACEERQNLKDVSQ